MYNRVLYSGIYTRIHIYVYRYIIDYPNYLDYHIDYIACYDKKRYNLQHKMIYRLYTYVYYRMYRLYIYAI